MRDTHQTKVASRNKVWDLRWPAETILINYYLCFQGENDIHGLQNLKLVVLLKPLASYEPSWAEHYRMSIKISQLSCQEVKMRTALGNVKYNPINVKQIELFLSTYGKPGQDSLQPWPSIAGWMSHWNQCPHLTLTPQHNIMAPCPEEHANFLWRVFYPLGTWMNTHFFQ